jgi:hypothetical protein
MPAALATMPAKMTMDTSCTPYARNRSVTAMAEPEAM